jgi:CubicO group peptidase (beta-lactamase class C family)
VHVPLGGRIDPAFGALGEAFRANFVPSADRPPDLGAALCVVVDGAVVVDCWGGWCDPSMRRPWARETLVNAYSVLKPVAAVLALMLVEAGELDLDGPVAAVWPGFAQAGKAHITLRDVLAHRAGLPGVRAVLPDAAMLDWDTMCGGLAASRPWWEPGRGHGYHVNTFGFLAGEPVRRRTGSSFGGALRARMTGPLDLDLHVGLDAADLTRVADIDTPGPVSEPPGNPVVLTGDERQQMLLHAYFNPPGLSGFGVVNTAAWRRSAIPSTNGHATARGVAAFYASLLAGAPHPLLARGLVAEATTTHSEGHDLVLDRPTRFGLGFALHLDERPVGTTPAAFGHYGYGGSLGFADPDAGVAFAYLINRPGDRWQNPRTRALLDAVRSCL